MVMPLQPRFCQLCKKEGGSFGFFLRIEKAVKGHLVRAVVKEGPADCGGLKDGDRVLMVNGIFVDTEEHQQVAELIKNSGTSVSLTVLDGDSYVNANKQGIDLLQLSCAEPGPNKPLLNGVSENTPRPKLCYLMKQDCGFGFSLKTIEGVPGLFMMEISPLGAASIAGVQPNDRIIELNGENIEHFTHQQMVSKMKSSGNNIVLLLIDEASDKYFKSRAIKVVASMASVKEMPHKPRIAELTKESQGYGFFLRMEQGHQGHFIRAIDPNSPAEKAGLADGDLLVAVNGTAVEHLDHEPVVDLIKKCGNKTTFLVVNEATKQLYKQAGISPICYWNEVHESPCAEKVVTPRESLRSEDSPSPNSGAKLYHLTKGPEGYGFTLNAVRGMQGQFIRQIVNGSPASEAGLEVSDILIEVNGVNVEVDTHDELVKKISSSGDKLSLLVVGKEEYEDFKASKTALSPPIIPKATPEAIPKATPEAIPEATPEATREATPEPTSGTTREATPEPTPKAISTPNDTQEDSRVEKTLEEPEADELAQRPGDQDKCSSSSSDEATADNDTLM
ncbi:Na(+)/H(+) exchange regulatory cofactor NHE-RF3 [Amblyraja radiata]|uniref:Na(+)/H(+) exchange regulatory cofactor NHE-RF3 n=1 Tax=Amblyraja radiata TaxID=386614 RepID=UPI001401EF5B|nr:Na(+)/H(+) exchange regulatory cofactor NHE-RF3 [Amblyraja radiata]XP_032879000.1 Na(+)/H(+) exchange regulatory cofactor NHE-RF3 [Amblyraja radiata]